MALLYTIGHSKHDITDFLALLKDKSIEIVADVRSEPFSHRMPQFARAELVRFLEADRIAYVYLGERLGGRPEDTSLYTAKGALNYDRLTSSEDFLSGISELVDLASAHRLVILCSQGLPDRCHRESILGMFLRSKGHRVLHILPDGGVRENQQLVLL